MTETRDGTIRLPKKASKVRNKAPAPVQITAEQLLREAKERDLEIVAAPPKQKITDEEELKEFQLRRRKTFEDNIRKNRSIVSNWIKYAKWEESQFELQRARSIFERALDVDHRNISLWLQYAEAEMRNRQVNHARNIWDRAVTILPRTNQFWYKYTYMEEMLQNIAGARQVFERWMEWEPEEQPWLTFIKFELRYKEFERARIIYQRFISCHPEVKNWIRYARFEEQHGNIGASRQVYEQAVAYFGDDAAEERLLVAFARFEENQKEHERVRVIYKYALDHISKDKTVDIFKQYTKHEKKYGDRVDIENITVSKRKRQYEGQIQKLKDSPEMYDVLIDVWFDYLLLVESEGDVDAIREAYEQAIANLPPKQEKRAWRRYIYLWIYYAVYEELEVQDYERAREVYKACLEIIPHSVFTFSKVWVIFAKFEIRQRNLAAARKIMGTAIGKCPKDKSFREYINLELNLREFDRCRILYGKWLEFSPENCANWIKFAEMEELLGEVERARAVLSLAIRQPVLDMPELLWKAYVDFEIREEEFERARQLYERLLQKTQHVKVWLSYAKFAFETGLPDCLEDSRKLYQRANKTLPRTAQDKEERILLLEAWKGFEAEHGTPESQAAVQKQMPERVKKRKKIVLDDGTEAGWEEYYDYIFPDDEAAQSNLKLLAMAKQWKTIEFHHSGDEDDGDDEEDVSGDDIGDNPDDLPSDPSDKTKGNRMEPSSPDGSPPPREDKVREGDSDTDISMDSSEEDSDDDR